MMPNELAKDIEFDEVTKGLSSEAKTALLEAKKAKENFNENQENLEENTIEIEGSILAVMCTAKADQALHDRIMSIECRSDAKHQFALKSAKLILGDKYKRNTNTDIVATTSDDDKSSVPNSSKCSTKNSSFLNTCSVILSCVYEQGIGSLKDIPVKEQYENWVLDSDGDPKSANFISNNLDKKKGGGNRARALQVSKLHHKNKEGNVDEISVRERLPAISAAANVILENSILGRNGIKNWRTEIPVGAVTQFSGLFNALIKVEIDTEDGADEPKKIGHVIDVTPDNGKLSLSTKLLDKLLQTTALGTSVNFDEQMYQSLLMRTFVNLESKSEDKDKDKNKASVYIAKHDEYVKIVTAVKGMGVQSMSCSRDFSIKDCPLEDKAYVIEPDVCREIQTVLTKKLGPTLVYLEKDPNSDDFNLVIKFDGQGIKTLEDVESFLKAGLKIDNEAKYKFAYIAKKAKRVKNDDGVTHEPLIIFPVKCLDDLNVVVAKVNYREKLDYIPALKDGIEPIFEYKMNKDDIASLYQFLKKERIYAPKTPSYDPVGDEIAYIKFHKNSWSISSSNENVYSIGEFADFMKVSDKSNTHIYGENEGAICVDLKQFERLSKKFGKSTWTLKVYEDAIEMHLSTQKKVVTNFLIPNANSIGGYEKSNVITTDYFNQYSHEDQYSINSEDMQALRDYKKLLEQKRKEAEEKAKAEAKPKSKSQTCTNGKSSGNS